jgi:CHAT domain-containing protein/tetratricopeptide (TPR) repeat protein
MDEHRLEAYLNLIQQLLNCPSGEELDILNANREFVDVGLVQVMQQVAEMMAQQGEPNAGWLQNLAVAITKMLKDSSSSTTLQEYLSFLQELLQAEWESNGDSQRVNQVLRRNLDKLDENFAQIFPQLATDLIADHPEAAASIVALVGNISIRIQEFPLGTIAINQEIAIAGYELVISNREANTETWAQTQNNLANAYRNRIFGDRAQNLEEAIACLQNALQVYTREAFPVDWAMTQNNLANAYSDRIKGDRAQNLEEAIARYQNALEVRTREALQVDWAMTQNNLAAAYSNRILGDRAQNLEEAIFCYQDALQVYTREAFPVQWAATQNNLAAAYSNRIKGDRAQNLEEAIACLQNALQVRSREAFPVDWAMTQNNLANAYSHRIRGDRAKNLEEAIACYQDALQVYTREAFPVQWAATQNNLAAAYSHRIFGDRAQNLEEAIARYQDALQVRTREAFPVQWAATQDNLATAYSDRILGDRAQNLELAIASYQNALEVYTREAFPVDWAMTQNNLAIAYSHRILGDRAQNLELAIASYQDALQVRTREAFPVDWATTQNNLAIAYSDRIFGDRAQNLEEAIASYQNALQVRSREAFPVDWAMTQNNLAIAYSDRIFGDRAQNLEEAIPRYQNALEVRTREAFPVDWATTQNNLANAYCQRIFGDRAQNLEEAIARYQNALEVWTPSAFPLDCLIAGRNFGNLALSEGNWQLAIEGYEKAIAAVEQSRTWATNDERRQEILAESIDIYEKMVQACINNGQLDKAIEYAERSRSQRLVDLMASNDLYAGGDIPPQVQEYLQQFADKQQEIDQLRHGKDAGKERELVEATRSRAKLTEDNAKIQALEGELQEIWRQIRKLDPMLSGQIQVAAPNLAAMQQLVDDDKTAILSFYTTTDDTYIFVLRKNHLSCHSCQGQGRQELQRWIYENWLEPYVFNKPQWRTNISQVLGELATRLRLNELIVEHLDGIEELIIVPHLYLHLIPFAAMPLDPPHAPHPQRGPHAPPFKRGEQEEEAEVSVSPFSKEVQAHLQVPPLNKGGLGGVAPVVLPNTPPQPPLLRGEQDKQAEIPVPPLVKGGLGGDRLTQAKRREILGDKFLIRYVPSCQILEYCKNRPPVETPLEYGTAEDATEDLPCSNFEGEQVAQLYQIPENRRYRGRQGATVANYRQLAKQVQGILSTHHAQSRLDNPLQSELLLGNGSITLGELLTPGWRLPQLVDVFLSCCETGLGLPETFTDDILTLSFGFLCAGARSVVSTLWAVDDLATALFSLFYHRYKKELSRPAALRKAQEELRTLTGETLAQAYKPSLQPLLQEKLAQTIEAKKQAHAAYKQARKQSLDTVDDWKKELNRIDKTQEKLEKAIQRLNSACKELFPFSDYFYWSAFTCQGLR